MGRIKVLAAVLMGCLILAFAPAAHAFNPSNDNLAAATDLGSGPTVADTGPILGATSEPGESGYPATASVWEKWTAPAATGVTVSMCNGNIQFDSLLQVYTGPATNPTFANITQITSDDNGCGGQLSRVKFTSVAGQTYYIAVVDKDMGTAGGTYEVEIGTAPVNDDFPGTTLQSTLPVSASGSNANATKETGEPNHAGDPGGASLWWTWQAPSAGDVVVDTCGSAIDTVLGVYTGGAFAGVTQVAANDDGCNLQQSKVKFTAAAGTLYRIAVDGKDNVVAGGPAIGNIQLHLGPAAPNDDLADATAISGLPVATTGDDTYSTHQANENAHSGVVGAGSIWYAWTAPSNGTVAIDTCGSTVNTLLGVYSSGTAFPLTELASNHNACGSGSRVTLPVTMSTVYLIAIDGEGGPVLLDISDASVPTTTIDTATIKPRRHFASFTFSGTVPSGTLSFECKLDNGAFAACTPPFTKRRMRPGLHTFSVRSTNGSLVDPSPATKTFRIRR